MPSTTHTAPCKSGGRLDQPVMSKQRYVRIMVLGRGPHGVQVVQLRVAHQP